MNYPKTKTKLWRVINDLAFDAAAAAAAWHVAFGKAWSLPVTTASLVVLMLSVWLVYLGDRWLDVWGRAPEKLPTQRHRFTARHRWSLLALWFAVLPFDVTLALAGLTPSELWGGLALLLATVLYTLGVQKRLPKRWTKELQVGLIFAAGVGVFFLAQPMDHVSAAAMLLGLGVFGLVCFLNCALLARWEMDADRGLGRSSLALALGKRSVWLRRGAGGAAVLCAGLVATLPVALMLCLSLYSAGLWAMDVWQWPVDPEDRRCVADGSLALLGMVAALLS